MIAYSLLYNHVLLHSALIGAHEYEGHDVFDIWYRNTADIVSMAITGDMHSINKANVAILHWFGRRFAPRYTDLPRERKELACADTPAYEKCLIQPTGQIDLQVIINEKSNIDRIVATLGLKEITQGTLIRSISTLRYLRDPQSGTHRVQLAKPYRVPPSAP